MNAGRDFLGPSAINVRRGIGIFQSVKFVLVIREGRRLGKIAVKIANARWVMLIAGN